MPTFVPFVSLLCLLSFGSMACLGSTIISGEENIELRCAEAAEALTSCTGASSEEFERSCVADPDEETFAIVDDIVDSSCGGSIQMGGAEIGETLFATQCMSALGAATLVSRLRNNWADPLTASDKALLREEFGSLVDEVSFYFNARIIDEWNLGFTQVQFSFDVYAQTLGTRIYVDDDYRPGNAAQLATLAHELAHAQQSKQAGGFYPGFAYNYCVALYRADFSYSGNALEVEANQVKRAFQHDHM